MNEKTKYKNIDFFALKKQGLIPVNDKFRETMYHLEKANSLVLDVKLDAEDINHEHLKKFTDEMLKKINDIYNNFKTKGYGLL